MAKPDIFNVFDGDAVAQLAALVNGVPQKVLRPLAAAPAANQAAGAVEKMVKSGAAPQSA